MVYVRTEEDFLIVECDCFNTDGRILIIKNNTKLMLCEKCYIALKEQIKKEI